MNHLTPEQLDDIVSGASSGSAAELRIHLAECATCARRLADRARFEEQMEAAAARVGTARRTGGRIALALAAGLLVLLGAGLALLRPAPHGEVAQAQRPVPSRAPVPAVIAASAPGLASPAPGLAERIPRLCEDVVLPAEPCCDPANPACSAPEPPALSLP